MGINFKPKLKTLGASFASGIKADIVELLLAVPGLAKETANASLNIALYRPKLFYNIGKAIANKCKIDNGTRAGKLLNDLIFVGVAAGFGAAICFGALGALWLFSELTGAPIQLDPNATQTLPPNNPVPPQVVIPRIPYF